MNKVLAFFMLVLPILACAQTVGTFSNQHANRDNLRVELLKRTTNRIMSVSMLKLNVDMVRCG